MDKKLITGSCLLWLSSLCMAQETDTIISAEPLHEVVVTARHRGLLHTSETGKIHFNTEQLTQIPSVMGAPDIIKTLQLIPGVQNAGEANGYLYVRGADPGHNLLLYNDAPVYGMSHLLGIFPFFNTDAIRKVHFDKSNADARFGNRLCATLQVNSPEELPVQPSIRGNVGLLASQLSAEIPAGKKMALTISARKTYVDEIIGAIVNAKKIEEEGNHDLEELGYSFGDANISLLAKPTDTHTLGLSVFFSKDHFDLTENNMLLDGKMKWRNSVGSAFWNWDIAPHTQFRQSFYVSNYNNELQAKQALIGITTTSKITEWGAKSLLAFERRKTLFETGVQLAGYRVRPQDLYSNQIESAPFRRTNDIERAWQAVAFLQARPQPTENLWADIGLRFSYFRNTDTDANAYFHLEPHLSLHYRPNDHFRYYASYSFRHQYVNLITTSSVGFPTDFWTITSNDIPAQSAHNYSIGSIYKPFTQVEITASLFYNTLQNLTEYPYNPLQFNEITTLGEDLHTGKGRAYGLEWMLRKSGQLSGWLSYTLSRSERRFDDLHKNETFPAKFDQRHNLSVVAHYKLSHRWGIAATQTYTSGNRFTTPTSWYFINNTPVKEYGKLNNAKMPDYTRTDLSIDYYLKKTHRKESVINVSVYNLFAVTNPIYVILDVRYDEKENKISIRSLYKKFYTILPSVSWRFKF